MRKALLLVVAVIVLQGCSSKEEEALEVMWSRWAGKTERELGIKYVKLDGEIVDKGTIEGGTYDIKGRVPAYVGCFNFKSADGSPRPYPDERVCIFYPDVGDKAPINVIRESLYRADGFYRASSLMYESDGTIQAKKQQQAAVPPPAVTQQPKAPAPAANQSVYGDKAVPLVETLECRKWRESGASGGIGGNVYSVNSLAINKLDLPAVQGLTTNHEAPEHGGERVTVVLPDEVRVYGAAVGEIYLVNQEAVVEQQLYLAHPVNNLVPMVNRALGVTLEWNAGMEAWVFEQDGKHVMVSVGPRPDTSKLTCGFS